MINNKLINVNLIKLRSRMKSASKPSDGMPAKDAAKSELDAKTVVPKTPAIAPTLQPADEKKPKVLAASLDFDHALAYNLDKLRTLKTEEEKIQHIVNDNQHLLSTLAAKAITEGYDKVVLLIGTNRQSWFDDFHCGFVHKDTQGSGSCFPVYLALEKQLKIEIEAFKKKLQTEEMCKSLGKEFADICLKRNPEVVADFHLLADDYNSKDGAILDALQCNALHQQAAELFSYYHSILNSPEHRTHLLSGKPYKVKGKTEPILMQAPTLFDQTKISLLYAQMQRIAKRFQNYHIDFLFLDDNIPQILKSLADFYEQHREFTPPDLDLQLFQYHKENAATIELHKDNAYKVITGKENHVDSDYRDNLILWSAITLNILKYDGIQKTYFINKMNVGPHGEKIPIEVLRREIFRFMSLSIGEHITQLELDFRHTPEKALTFKFLRLQRLTAKQLAAASPPPVVSSYSTHQTKYIFVATKGKVTKAAPAPALNPALTNVTAHRAK